jgi:hypothetical protein
MSAVRLPQSIVRTLVATAASLGSGCELPATQVLVVLDTDAPMTQRLDLRATVSLPESTIAPNPRTWSHGGDARPSIRLPASFSVVPADGAPKNGRVLLYVDATLRTSPTTTVSFRRTATFDFRPNESWTLRVFIATSCLAPATGCTRSGVCTVAQRCDEQGLTCGDEGRCVRREAVLTPSDLDADTAGRDARSIDAMDVANLPDISEPPDVATFDVPTPMDTGPMCPSGSRRCGGVCVSVSDDPRHCGGCDRACAAGQGCVAGACTACTAPRAMCGADCVNRDNNTSHCGACGNACPDRPNATSTCTSARCGISCAAPFIDCDGRDDTGCEINSSNDPSQCGMCGVRCSGGMACVSGRCQCPAGQSNCGGTCRSTGAPCSTGVGACARMGRVVCSGSSTMCDAVAGAPATETCNGLDDNCDGTTDEDPACLACVGFSSRLMVNNLALLEGDREFEGHGPTVTLTSSWSIVGDRVQAEACVRARETTSNWTTGYGCRTLLSDAAPSAIAAVLEGNYSGGYTDTDHSCDFVGGGSGVASVTCVGDTSGDDICVGSSTCGANSCTGCDFAFGCVRVRLRP